MSERAIASLALIDVEWDRGRGYIGSFVPLVAECLRTAPQAEVSLPEIQESFVEAFGFRVPLGALKTIVRRAVKEGYARAEHGIFRRNEQALAELQFSERRVDALRQFEGLIDKLVHFAESSFQVSWTRTQGETALFSYLRKHHIPLMRSIVEPESEMQPLQGEQQANFIVGAFVADICRSDPEGFSYLGTIVEGSMLANVLYFPDLGSVQQRFGQTEVYFDTQFLLRALGQAGPRLQAPCLELLDLLHQLDAKIRCFEQTKEEVQGVLEFVANTLRNPQWTREAYGEVIEYYVQTGLQASDAELALIRLDESFSRRRIKIKRVPPHRQQLGIDEEKLESVLQDEIGYSREAAQIHDQNALSAIYRLRRGRLPRRIETASAVFVTTNGSLVQASRRFFRDEYGSEAVAVPHCILDDVLTTLAWLKKPKRAPNLPQKALAANCYAAMQPSDALWKAYIERIGQLRAKGDVSADEFYLLRYSVEAREILMGLTLGDPRAFAEGTPQEVLERALQSVRAEDRAELAAEKKKRREAERKAAAVEARERRAKQAQRDHLMSIADSVGSVVKTVALSGFILLQLVGFAVVCWPGLLHGEWRWILLGLLAVLAVTEGYDLTTGRSLRSVLHRIEVSVSRAVEGALIRLLVPSVQQS